MVVFSMDFGHVLQCLTLFECKIPRCISCPNPQLLDWLAREGRILLTHDVRTMPGFVYERVRASLPVPGVIDVNRSTPIGQAIDELEVMIGAGKPDDFENLVRYVPLR